MKKSVFLLMLLLITVMLISACSESKAPDKTATPEKTATPAAEKTPTPEPTATPTATPDPYENDIMGYAVEEPKYGGDGITGDGWSSSPSSWWSPLQEGDGNPTRTFGIIAFLNDMELSNGKTGPAISLSWDCDAEFERGQLIGLNYGLKGMLKPDTVYKAVLTYKLTFGPDGPVEGHNTRLWYSAAAESTNMNGVPLEETSEWKTAEYIFKTGNDVDEDVYLQMGPSSHLGLAGWVRSGFELLVERVSLTEYEGEVNFG